MARKSFYKQSAKVESNATTTTFEVEKPVHFTKSGDAPLVYLAPKNRWLGWFVVSGLIFLLFCLGSMLGVGWWYWHQFEASAGTRLLPLIQEVWKNKSADIFSNRNYKTFLLLGVDQSANMRENSMLTDTIMVAVIKNNGEISMISLPRDLWIDSLKTKINALYYYGQQTNPGDGVTLLSSVITEMTGLPMDYYFVINMDTVKALVDAVGGVNVPVARTFEDAAYPREIDISSTDPAVLYETVRFNAGSQHMDGITALKFIRSRHSTDEFEGTDEGREQRQQLLLATLKKELVRPNIISNPTIMGALYKVWKNSIKTNMSDVDAFLLAKGIKTQAINVNSTIIPVQEGSQSGLIFHPVKGPANQWVYEPLDASWAAMHEWFKAQMKLE